MAVQNGRGYGLDPDNLDLSVSPRDNFFQFSNGGWMSNPVNACPTEYPSWNTFRILADANLDRLKNLLANLSASTSAASSESEGDAERSKLQAFYSAWMNEEEIESAQLPQKFLSLVAKCHDVNLELTQKLSLLHFDYGVNVLFRFYSMPDKDNSVMTIGSFGQGGLGLPDRDYYYDQDKEQKRQKYIEHIVKMLVLMGERGVGAYKDPAECSQIAALIFNIELQIAKSHMTRTECRDPQATWNKMSPEELDAACRRAPVPVSWATYLAKGPPRSTLKMIQYLENSGLTAPPAFINVAHVNALKQAAVIGMTSGFEHYLAFHCVESFAPHLCKVFKDEHFQFHETVLKGTLEQKPRWKTGLAHLESALGDALGKLYVAEYFTEDDKQSALAIVESVRQAMRSRLTEVEWMSQSTREGALKKMDAFRVKIGYPDADAWIDYSDLECGPVHLDNVIAARHHQIKLDLNRVDMPTDKKRWLMFPHQVNAYYHPMLNEIVFPAAILQSPFYDVKADIAVQFGSFGCVVAHEITHGFDDQGRKFDDSGNMRDWWEKGDGEEYERRKAVMVKQASEFQVFGQNLNGNLTCGENIADLGGVKLAYRALMARPEVSTAAPINGFTPQQRFFLAWSQTWRDNSKEDYKKSMITLDPHGPHEFRANAPLSNFEPFHVAFDVKEGDKMFKSPQERVDIW